ncbi:MAG: GTP-binding protein [Clostridia bacterium]|nr:GTP-binding protein [Clostridia bacterium]
MQNTKLAIVGGFLGAGKTTAILALGTCLRAKGLRVGIVTNDQGGELVDTRYLEEHGFSVLEVTGGCFCCNFDQLSQKLDQMSQQEFPDYILAEPVGSCTDLISTIMKPIHGGRAGQFELAPLSVVCDPLRLRRFMQEKQSAFPNQINYLFSKQLEEAEVIVLNKYDLLQDGEAERMEKFLSERYKGIVILPVSAKTGAGVEEWLGCILSAESRSEKTLDIEYDTYAAAEASLGWLNLGAEIRGHDGAAFDGNAFSRALMTDLRERLEANGSEIAHLKLYLVSASDTCKLSCVSIYEEIIEDKHMATSPSQCSLIVNLRACASPEFLSTAIRGSLDALAHTMALEISQTAHESFYPGYPKPKYRM